MTGPTTAADELAQHLRDTGRVGLLDLLQRALAEARQQDTSALRTLALAVHQADDGDYPPLEVDWEYIVSISRRIAALPPSAPPELDVDELAQIIREEDGDHSLGAGAVAERIVARLEQDHP